MTSLAAFLALNGVLVVFLGSAAGVALYRKLIGGGDPHDWHLLHAGGTARGILLIALGGTVHLARLPAGQTETAAGLVVLFVWASTLAMLLRAVTGEPGFGLSGPLANRVGFVLYVIGAICLFPGLAWLSWGFLNAL